MSKKQAAAAQHAPGFKHDPVVTQVTERLIVLYQAQKELADEVRRLKDRVKVFFAEGRGMVFHAPSGAVTIRRVNGRELFKKERAAQYLSAVQYRACIDETSPSLRVEVSVDEVNR